VGPLGKLPPWEECPICMLVMPIDERFCRYFPCCGKSMCGGCCYQHEKSREQATEREQMWVPHACAFCRTAVPESDEAVLLARLRKRELSAKVLIAKQHPLMILRSYRTTRIRMSHSWWSWLRHCRSWRVVPCSWRGVPCSVRSVRMSAYVPWSLR